MVKRAANQLNNLYCFFKAYQLENVHVVIKPKALNFLFCYTKQSETIYVVNLHVVGNLFDPSSAYYRVHFCLHFKSRF